MSKSIPTTTSCGRILDAVSALLGICFERTFEGEPAMKLESSAINGKDALKIEPDIKDGVIDTTWLLRRIFEEKNRYSISDLAYSAEEYLAKSLAAQAVDVAKYTDVKSIGLSGGVAYNKHITFTIKEIVEEEGLRFKSHIRIPPGDAGISFGQVIAVRKKANQQHFSTC
jgi:hydrogenase maturation protein HypF